jgi:hypothetical protein
MTLRTNDHGLRRGGATSAGLRGRSGTSVSSIFPGASIGSASEAPCPSAKVTPATSWAGRWALGAGGAVDLGENPEE